MSQYVCHKPLLSASLFSSYSGISQRMPDYLQLCVQPFCDFLFKTCLPPLEMNPIPKNTVKTGMRHPDMQQPLCLCGGISWRWQQLLLR